ncbi:hypothetical protein GLAREA_06963 [Glarea lozoyensis ATCC 20868]|uniref:DUF7587 domain-containing protein n=1 Tax=Glarea lozoyensis (strain ATCC 20868 / MF5171) TaxID=1116229 RepID=S3D865_GLAL2|nr:uncharacterized protein GLAREA_06963 [Glarea lozoyensis ATCC 20868]EPE33950.1 hypothetical protein GLAREA_06963 [Glarea lozoyensis ATCC 20868]
MTDNIVALTNSVNSLEITDTTSEADDQTSDNPALVIQASITLLESSTKFVASQERRARSLADSTNIVDSLYINDLYSGYKKVTGLAEEIRILSETADNFKDAAQDCLFAYLVSLGSRSAAWVSEKSFLQDLLSHFVVELKDISRYVLDHSKDETQVLWKIAEECYNQATNCPGMLNPGDYFDKHREAAFEWPYDLEYEPAEYYEHENLLNVDEDYAREFHDQNEERAERAARQEQSWVEFWVAVLDNCPSGPTLFYPRASSNTKIWEFETTATPRYLFRTFDQKSSGRNDDCVIASTMAVMSLQDSRIDLLSLPKNQATSILHAHLTKSCWGSGAASDNLMSWTSSLLFAIQYAIWRRDTFKSNPEDIRICAIDTMKFPRGQFVQDLSLITAYQQEIENLEGREKNLFQLRRDDTRYHNGEYFSQGTVNIAGRSSMASLKSLKGFGLFKLYPEFDVEMMGKSRWTNRVRDLRLVWSKEQNTTTEEIQFASSVAMCFNDFKKPDMMLYSYRSRLAK